MRSVSFLPSFEVLPVWPSPYMPKLPMSTNATLGSPSYRSANALRNAEYFSRKTGSS